MPYFPLTEQAPYKCEGCGGWFYHATQSCCVAHAHGTCCHEYEQPAPHPIRSDCPSPEHPNYRHQFQSIGQEPV